MGARYCVVLIACLIWLSCGESGIQPVEEIQDDNGIIAYEDKANIYIINPDGTDDTFVTHGYDPHISPDRRFLVHVVNLRTENPTLHITRIDGAQTFQLTDSDVGAGFEPAWSPDGTRIAFSDGNINVIDIDGTNLTHVVLDGRQPSWSPDGLAIAFSRDPSGEDTGRNIYTINIDGSGLKQWTNAPGDEESPDWSPDGRSILYMGRVGRTWSVFVVNRHFHSVRLIRIGNIFKYPVWSPDGKRIAVWRHLGSHWGIYMAPAEVSSQVEPIKLGANARAIDWR